MRNLLSWIKAHPYSLWVTYYIPYLICFILLEQFSDPKFIIYSPIDDMIPFCEYFIIFYLMWFPLMFLSLLYFLLKDKDAFIDLCFLMFTGMSISLLIYVIAPNGLDLRVEIASDNLFAWMVRMIQTVDDPTNVCPSIHVASTLAIMMVVLKHREFRHPLLAKGGVSLISVSIILSTMFLKQHSIIDAAAGIALTLILYVITYHTGWRKLFQRTPLRFLVSERPSPAKKTGSS